MTLRRDPDGTLPATQAAPRPTLTLDTGANESPVAAGRALLLAAWDRLDRGEIECLDIHLRNGWVVADVIALRVHGATAEAAMSIGRWDIAFALDEIALVRCIDFGRFRD